MWSRDLEWRISSTAGVVPPCARSAHSSMRFAPPSPAASAASNDSTAASISTANQLVHKPHLSGQDSPLCLVDREPCRAIDLGEFASFECEGVALHQRGIAVHRECPGVHDLAAALLERCQQSELSCGDEARLLREFAAGRREGILARLEFPLG